MSQEDKRSRQIFRKVIDIHGRDYAVDLYDGDLPSLSEGDKALIRERAGIYTIGFVEKEDPDHKCDKDHHWCKDHKRCERDDHDCDKDGPDTHDDGLDKRILDDIDFQTSLLKKILADVEDDKNDDRDKDLDRKTLNAVLSLTNVCNTILSILQNSPPPSPIPIPPPPSPSPSPIPPPSPTPSPPPPKEQSHTRVIIQGEFDVPHSEITEEDKPEDPLFQRQLVEKFVNVMKKENPDFKITKTLVARGVGPVKVAW